MKDQETRQPSTPSASVEQDNDLTLAYMTGYHKRDDEIAELRRQLAALESLINGNAAMNAERK
jgi:hypothetical protein